MALSLSSILTTSISFIHVFLVFENLDKIVIVMEYAAGGELYEYLASKSGVTDEEARGFFRQIVSAVRYCHRVSKVLFLLQIITDDFQIKKLRTERFRY